MKSYQFHGRKALDDIVTMLRPELRRLMCAYSIDSIHLSDSKSQVSCWGGHFIMREDKSGVYSTLTKFETVDVVGSLNYLSDNWQFVTNLDDEALTLMHHLLIFNGALPSLLGSLGDADDYVGSLRQVVSSPALFMYSHLQNSVPVYCCPTTNLNPLLHSYLSNKSGDYWFEEIAPETKLRIDFYD